MRISTKLILILVTAVVSVMAAYALITISRTQDRLDEELFKMAEHIGLALNGGVLHHLKAGDVEGVRAVLETISQYEDVMGAAVFDRKGKLVAASRSVAGEWEGETLIYTDPVGTGRYTGEEEDHRVYTYVMSVKNAEGGVLGSLKLALGAKSLLPYVIEARNYILGTILVLTGVLTALIIYFSQSQIAGPLKVLTEGAEVIGQGQLSHRIAIHEEGEVGALAAAFNGMAASLETTTREIIREREYIRNIVDSIAEGIVVINREEGITAWNQTMERRYDLPLEKVLCKKLSDVFPDLYTRDFQSTFSGLLEGNIPQFAVHKVVLKAAPERMLTVMGSPLRDPQDRINGAVLVLADITERVRLEQQIQQSEKMAAVGQLAAGIAHEIGTPLNVISGSAEYLLMDVDEEDGRTEELKTIVSEVGRISELVKQLMEFARHEEPREENIDAGELIDSILVLLRRQIEKQGIQIDVDLEPNLPEISGDRNQIQQVLLNLIMNAWQAMPEGGGLALQGRYLSPEQVEGQGEIPGSKDASGWIELRVKDRGAGIPEAYFEKIFDPFFSTKDVGEGTGLGLAIVQRIVENHSGQVTVTSREGEGTTFTVVLPAHCKECSDV